MVRLNFFLLILLVISCEKDNPNPNSQENPDNKILTDTIIIPSDIDSPTINKGFYGFILEWKGDFMPGSDNTSGGTIDSVQMDLYVYTKLTFDSVMNARTDDFSVFYLVDSIKQTPLNIIKSNNKGFYQIMLDSGVYTGLVKINKDSFYINGGLGDGHIGAMIIESDTLIKRNFNIDYEISI
jgi:hypothetical protein